MTVVIGQLLDDDGLALQYSQHVVPADPLRHGRNFNVETRAKVRAEPARNVRPRQGERIPLNIGHHADAEIGHVVHLEYAGRHLWAVCQLDDDLDLDLDGQPWRFSAETLGSYERGSLTATDIEITGIGLVSRTAQTGLEPVRFLDGRVERRSYWGHRLRPVEESILNNAADVTRDRRNHRPIQVLGLRDPDQEHAWQMAHTAADYYRANPGAPRDPHGPGAPIEHSKHRGKVLRVS